jgi:ABC-type transporter MlaC component
MRKLFCTIAVLAALPLFSACEPTVEDAQQDVREAQQEAAQDIRSEQRDVEQARQEGVQDIREEQRELQEAQEREALDRDSTVPGATP